MGIGMPNLKPSCYLSVPGKPFAARLEAIAIDLRSAGVPGSGLVLRLNVAFAKEHQNSLVNATSIFSGDRSILDQSGPRCLPLGPCNSRRLLLEDPLLRHIRPSIVTHRRQKHILSYKLTGPIPRKDALNHFRVYDGGFNVTDKHYWSSVTYTGIWGYVLAVLSLVFCIIYGFLYCCGCCYPVQEKGVSVWHYISVYGFGIIAIVAAGVIYWGNAKLGQQLRATAGTLVTATDGIQSEINNALAMVQVAAMFPISRQGSSQQFLQACINLGNTFNSLERKVKKNKDRVYRIFDNVKTALTVVSAVIAAVVVLGLGISYALTNVANDACQIMNEYDHNPQNCSISKYLPCLSNMEANKALAGAKEAIKSLVTQANVAIDWVNREEKRIASRRNAPVDFELPRVCDPYGPPPTYSDSLCVSGETSFADFEKVYGPFRCENDNLTHCFQVDTPIPNFAYQEADMAMNASNIVYRMLPTIFRIITCNFVKVTFEDILIHNCKPLQRALTSLWAGFVVASLAMMPLLILWTRVGKGDRGDQQGFLAGTYMSPNNFVGRMDIPSYSRGICGRCQGLFGGCRSILCEGCILCGTCCGGVTSGNRVQGPGPGATSFYPAVVQPLSRPASRAATPQVSTSAQAPAPEPPPPPPPPRPHPRPPKTMMAMVGPDGTPTTDFSIYGGDAGGSMRWLKKAVRRMSRAMIPTGMSSLTGSGPAASMAPTPRTAPPGSRVQTPGATPGFRPGTPGGPRIGTTDGKFAPPPPAGFPATPSNRNQGFS
ncbi:hypothetical protein R1sor_025083 [Riccia sorocarpa]|uniref:Tetraspanin n=1 Tax=Riccia sorocarpa TaxID=122646 RepID=A0ABD3G7J9_9MARC